MMKSIAIAQRSVTGRNVQVTDMEENERLIEYARAVRESTIKRLRCVPEGLENWRPCEDALSFADLAHHLIAADQWLLRKLQDASTLKMVAHPGEAGSCSRSEFLNLITELEAAGGQRTLLLGNLTNEALNKNIFDDRFGGDVTVWWIIVRGNLDHEAHHRGQIALYLRLCKAVV